MSDKLNVPFSLLFADMVEGDESKHPQGSKDLLLEHLAEKARRAIRRGHSPVFGSVPYLPVDGHEVSDSGYTRPDADLDALRELGPGGIRLAEFYQANGGIPRNAPSYAQNGIVPGWGAAYFTTGSDGNGGYVPDFYEDTGARRFLASKNCDRPQHVDDAVSDADESDIENLGSVTLDISNLDAPHYSRQTPLGRQDDFVYVEMREDGMTIGLQPIGRERIDTHEDEHIASRMNDF